MKTGAGSVAKMRRHWNRFAVRDPLYFACTNELARDPDAFYESGRAAVEHALTRLGGTVPRSRLLEIGCGPGRTAAHFAVHFERVDAIDISSEMIHLARRYCARPNLHFHVSSGADLSEFDSECIDVVYSWLMFQHIRDESIITAYLGEIRRVLRPHGRALLQFDTRPTTPTVRAASLIPGPLRPRTRRPFIRRYRRDAERLRTSLRDAGLAILDERGTNTAEHELMLTPSGAA